MWQAIALLVAGWALSRADKALDKKERKQRKHKKGR